MTGDALSGGWRLAKVAEHLSCTHDSSLLASEIVRHSSNAFGINAELPMDAWLASASLIRALDGTCSRFDGASCSLANQGAITVGVVYSHNLLRRTRRFTLSTTPSIMRLTDSTLRL